MKQPPPQPLQNPNATTFDEGSFSNFYGGATAKQKLNSSTMNLVGTARENDVSVDAMTNKVDQSIQLNGSITGSTSNLFGWLKRDGSKSKLPEATKPKEQLKKDEIAERAWAGKRDLSAPPARFGRVKRDEKTKTLKKEESSSKNLWSAILGATSGAESKKAD